MYMSYIDTHYLPAMIIDGPIKWKLTNIQSVLLNYAYRNARKCLVNKSDPKKIQLKTNLNQDSRSTSTSSQKFNTSFPRTQTM